MMSLSDPSDEESSSDASRSAAKRPRADTTGASSTTSYGSALQDSEDEAQEGQVAAPACRKNSTSQTRLVTYTEGSPESSARQSRSSLSENCSSPNERYDDFRPVHQDQDPDWPPKAGFGDDSSKVYAQNHDEGTSEKSVSYSNKAAMRMMSKMGYTVGKGLGKYEHGRTEPVEASTQKGRRGLGLKPSTLGSVPRDFKWTPDEAQPDAKEEVTWMPKPPDESLTVDQLEDWLEKGPKKLTIDDETDFVDSGILKGVIGAKNIFDELDAEELRKARFRSNPYETIGSLFFLNRAAVKMANIDAVFDFMFTKPRDAGGQSAVERGGLLYFADVCAGPGGFSEYVLYRRKWKAKGFGFTLKGPNDFKLSEFYAGSPETFCPYYGVEEDGNVFNPDNLASLKTHVLKQTEDRGVHLLMADGGFSVEGQENLQEVLSKQLYLCQCLAALMLVRTGGHFVVKLFDIFTPFSVGLVYLMYRCFEKVSIHKPVTSRPANSERYLVCAWKRPGTDCVERHLFSVNCYLWSSRGRDDADVARLVPVHILQEDTGFFNYIYNSNCVLGESQIKNLLKIGQFCRDKSLREVSQVEMKKRCLKLWQLPDEVRTQPQRPGPDETLAAVVALMKKPPPDWHGAPAIKASLGRMPHHIETAGDLKRFRSLYDWHFQFLYSTRHHNECSFFLSAGGNHVYQLNGTQWQIAVSLHLAMPAKTLLYGELVKELCGEGCQQTHTKALHVIDAVCLGGIDVSHLTLTERINQCEIFCTSLNKPLDSRYMAIRCKRIFNLEDFSRAMDRLEFRQLKIGQRALTVAAPASARADGTHLFHTVGSLLFFKEVKEPWEASLSRSRGTKYYFKVLNGKICTESLHHIVPEACMDAVGCIEGRSLWYWEPPSAVYEGQPHEGLRRQQLEEYIQYKSVHR